MNKSRTHFWLTISIGVFTVVLITYNWLTLQKLDPQKQMLMAKAQPTPPWILALGPKPNEAIPTTHIFGDIRGVDEFWPGYGIVCVQIDTKLAKVDEEIRLYPEDVYLAIDYNRIRHVSFQWLAYGLSPKRGHIFMTSAEDNPKGINYCWRMELEAGVHLATIRIHQTDGFELYYEWAFELINN